METWIRHEICQVGEKGKGALMNNKLTDMPRNAWYSKIGQ